jgi:hypothetical protein
MVWIAVITTALEVPTCAKQGKQKALAARCGPGGS